MLANYALVVSAEHASRACPPEFDVTGIEPGIFDTHAAWDPGVAEVAQAVAEALGAPLFLGRWTRLFCDLNRSPDTPQAIPGSAFGVEVRSNTALSDAERRARIDIHHRPHWDSVRAAIQAGFTRAPRVFHLSVHSFVETYQGRFRPTDLGVLVDPDAPLEAEISRWLQERLRGPRPYLVRENEPYDGREDALTCALRRELPPDRYAGVEIEINQRHLGAVEPIAALLTAALREIT